MCDCVQSCHLCSVGRAGCDRDTESMALFRVHRCDHVSIVIEAETAVAEAGWWVFRTVNGHPLAALPTTEVLGIKAMLAAPTTSKSGG